MTKHRRLDIQLDASQLVKVRALQQGHHQLNAAILLRTRTNPLEISPEVEKDNQQLKKVNLQRNLRRLK